MGEVFRARDSRLGREVAIKIVLEQFTADRERLVRFEREARALAALNHPNIAALYGIEEDAGRHFLVMELVPGQTLGERLAGGPLSLEPALVLARQMAEALEAAHEKGIVHRDLKPANIKITPDDVLKVLDFGLATVGDADRPAAGESLANSPTLTAMGTQAGMIIGTASYMSPEQARGMAADHRSDVFSFGVVLYEMLTGRQPFQGETVSDVLASVLAREPDLASLPSDLAPRLSELLRRCLEKQPKKRWQAIGHVRHELDVIMTNPRRVPDPVAIAAPPPPFWRRALPVVAGILIGAGLTWGALRTFGTPPEAAAESNETPIVTSIMAAPEAVTAFTYGLALSPDGQTLVYAARGADGTRRLWKRRLSESTSEPLEGTEDAEYPFWAPDSQRLGFFSGGRQVRSLSISGGPVSRITTLAYKRPAGSWSAKDEILISVGWGGGVYRVSASGGTPEHLKVDGSANYPQWLSDGRHFLLVKGRKTQIADIERPESLSPVPGLDTGDSNGQVRYSAAGFLIFNRSGVLNLQRFNQATLSAEGPVTTVGIPSSNPRGVMALTVADHSVVAFSAVETKTRRGGADPLSRLLWVDRTGRVIGEAASEASYWTLRLGEDDTRVLVNPGREVFVIDTRTGARTRLAQSNGALWMPGGREVLLTEPGPLTVLPASGEGQPRRISEQSLRPLTISPDGKYVVGLAPRDEDAGVSTDLFVLSLEDGSLKPLLATTFDEGQATFAPDGRWIAYTTDQTGRKEVYARPMDGSRPAVQISIDGGEHALWRLDGAEMYFLTPTDEVVAVDVSPLARTGMAGARKTLFRMVTNDITRELYPPYAVTRDGQRFLLNVPTPPEPLTLIQLPKR
jgi:serine/threonine protein kinase